MIRSLLAATLLAGSATVADAAQWDFSYVAGAGTLSGRIDGTLQGDGNTIFVSSLSGVKFNGTPGPALPALTSVSAFFSMAPNPPTLSLDGAGMDFLACNLLGCGGGQNFFFDGAGVFFQVALGSPIPYVSSSSSFGDLAEPYNAANWSISPAAAVPELSSWAMLIAGFGLVGAVARRRKAVAHAT